MKKEKEQIHSISRTTDKELMALNLDWHMQARRLAYQKYYTEKNILTSLEVYKNYTNLPSTLKSYTLTQLSIFLLGI